MEIGCGTASCGLACAALGASAVWLTDWDDDALSIARRNAECNGLDDRCKTAKLDFMQGFVDASERPAGMPRTFDLVLAAAVLCMRRGVQTLAARGSAPAHARAFVRLLVGRRLVGLVARDTRSGGELRGRLESRRPRTLRLWPAEEVRGCARRVRRV